MKYSKRVEIFEQLRGQYYTFLVSVLWKLTGDRELFAEALQYSLLGIWSNVHKLDGKHAGAYIYRIALSANSKAWRNRIGRNGQLNTSQIDLTKSPADMIGIKESSKIVRKEIAKLPAKQGQAIVMRYLEQKSYEDIAEKLQCSKSGARSNVSKALSTLKRKLKNE